jgi:DNA-binding NarL/FixJ family response regulator
MSQTPPPASIEPPPWTEGPAPPLAVLAVEDDFVMRRHLLGKLAEGKSLTVEVAATLAEGLEHLACRRFDIILVDLGLPDGSGLQIIETAMQLPDPPQVLVLSALRDEASVVAAISAGAGGYIVKDAPAHDILQAVYSVAAGYTPLSPSIARFLLRSFRSGLAKPASAPSGATAEQPSMGLTQREQDVLLQITRGSSYKEIAQTLSITEGTVQTHIKNVYRKLGVSNRSEAAYKLSHGSDQTQAAGSCG